MHNEIEANNVEENVFYCRFSSQLSSSFSFRNAFKTILPSKYRFALKPGSYSMPIFCEVVSSRDSDNPRGIPENFIVSGINDSIL